MISPRVHDLEVVRVIGQRVAAHTRTDYAAMRGRSRTQQIAFSRMVAMAIARRMTAVSFPIIGDAFNRDHSTVIHACNLIARRMQAESSFRRFIEDLEANVRHEQELQRVNQSLQLSGFCQFEGR